VDECEANSPSNLASSVTPLASRSSAPAEVSAEFFGSVAPLTMKLALFTALRGTFHTD